MWAPGASDVLTMLRCVTAPVRIRFVLVRTVIHRCGVGSCDFRKFPDTNYVGTALGGEIVDRIERALVRSGLTARQLAETSGLDESALSRVRSGARNLKASELSRVAEALGVSPLALLRDDSLLSELPMAARMDAVGGTSDAYQRIVALTELHEILDRSGIPATPLDPRHRAVIPEQAGWLPAVSALARATRAALTVDDGPDRFLATVTAIEHHFGVDVLVEDFPKDTLIGAALTDPRFPFIFVNAAQSRQRALFSLAHELGHLLAGHSGEGVWDRAKSFAGSTAEERIANAFAAEFLMPINGIRETIEEFGRGSEALAEMVLRFGVSYESLVYRLHNSRTITAEGRDALLSLRWTGLISSVEDPVRRSELLALGDAHPERHPPSWLTARVFTGFKDGVISVRPLAGLLNCPPDALLEAWESVRDSNPFEQDFRPSADSLVDDDELFQGASA